MYFRKDISDSASFRERVGFSTHQYGRQTFASNYTQGGFASTAFAPSSGEAFASAFRRKVTYGGEEHLRRLERLVAVDDSPEVLEAYNKVKAKGSGSQTARILGRVGGAALGLSFTMGLPALQAEGSVGKARAMTRGLAGELGWRAGSTLGMGAGAAAGTAIFPGIGTAIGAALGWGTGALGGLFGAEGLHDAILSVPDFIVNKERSRRESFQWIGDTSAFNTKKSYTMRQRSLEAMNRGMANSRSVLGREGVMIHQ